MGKHTLCRNPSALGGSWQESTSVIMYISTIFLDAHCQKQWASLGVIFSGKKEEGTENEKSGLQTNRTDDKSYGHRTNRTETNCTD